MTDQLFLVKSSALPEALLRTAQAKELLAQGKARTVNEAVRLVGISRSAFYKYKDGIYPYTPPAERKLVGLSLLLNHQTGVLSRVISTITELGGNIVTINQNIPVRGVANVSITTEIDHNVTSPDHLVSCLASVKGVSKVEIVS
ncbi:MAG TPA: ACT domain-containing protein [Clostridia bacterium]|nr:ACT domain-containing protein [Clostridia bacterium]